MLVYLRYVTTVLKTCNEPIFISNHSWAFWVNGCIGGGGTIMNLVDPLDIGFLLYWARKGIRAQEVPNPH